MLSGTRPYQVAFLTGQSDPRRWALSPAQAQFLEAIGVPPAARVRENFPYRPGSPAHAPTPLPVASLNNARQYLQSRRAAFRDAFRPDVLALLAAAERTLLLAGSCGLELLANLELPPAALATVSVFAYGPVARRRPPGAVTLVQGRRDGLSRAYFPRVDHRVDCGHLDYLADPTVRALARAAVAAVARDVR